MRRTLQLLAVVVVGGLVPATSSADPPVDGVLLVVSSPVGAACEIDAAIRGASPVVARLTPGEHLVACRVDVSGVSVSRSAKAIVEAGKGTKVTLDLAPLAPQGGS